MDVCGYGHDEIVYNERECPLCLANKEYNALEEKLADLEEQVAALKEEVKEVMELNAELEGMK